MRSMRLPRLVSAILVAGLTALTLGTVIGVANAADEPDSLPASFYVPAVQQGDRGAYDVTLDGSALEDAPRWKLDGDASFRLFDFVWNGTTTIVDGDGRARVVESVMATGFDYQPNFQGHDHDFDGSPDPSWIIMNSTAWFDAGLDTMVAYGFTDEWAEGSGPLKTPAGDIPMLAGSRIEVAFETVAYLDPVADCLLTASWQGQELGTDAPLERTPCVIPRLGLLVAGATLHAVGTEPVSGIELLTYADETGSMRYSFAPGISVPARVELRDHGVVLDLVHFAPGTQARAAPAPVGPAAAPLDVAPRQPWGIDEEGLEHPFSPQDVYTALLGDPRAPLFNDMVERERMTYFWDTFAFVTANEASRTYSWFILASDGGSAALLHVEKSIPYIEGASIPLAQGLGVVRIQEYESSFVGPDPDDLPTHLPTAQALLARAALHFELPDDALWTLWGLCVAECQIPYFVSVGAMEADQATAQVDPAAPRPLRLLAQDVSIEGILLDQEQVIASYQSDLYFTHDAGLGASEDGQAPLTPLSAGVTPVGWWTPTPAQAAGMGLVAVLSGAIYYAWPFLKTGMVGLFSRVHGPKILEHPARRLLVDLVQAEPGIHFKELQRRTDLANGSLVHHLRKLCESGFMISRQGAGYTCYFPPDMPRGSAAAAVATKAEGARRVLDAVARSPGVSLSDVALATGLQVSTVHHHVGRLADGGLITKRRDGRLTRLYAA